jgi:ubiquinol-cytochrome c reductase cytochrome b subunit
MIASICILFLVPFVYNCKIKSPKFKPLFRFFFYLFISNFLLLGWLGSQHIEPPFIILGQIGAIFHFAFFLIILPLLKILEDYLISFYIKLKCI